MQINNCNHKKDYITLLSFDLFLLNQTWGRIFGNNDQIKHGAFLVLLVLYSKWSHWETRYYHIVAYHKDDEPFYCKKYYNYYISLLLLTIIAFTIKSHVVGFHYKIFLALRMFFSSLGE